MSPSKRALSIERLERRELLTTTVMEIETNDTQAQANAFDLNGEEPTVLVGTSQNDDDKDWFVFTAGQAGTLSAEVTSPNGNLAALEVERANGTEVMSTDPNDGINTAQAEVAAGEQLFVRLRSKNDAAADYAATLSFGDIGGTGGDPEPSAFVEEVENNNRKSRATPFAVIPGGIVQLSGTSESDNDKDFFRFTMPADGDIRFTVNSPNNNFAQLQIEDVVGNDLTETDPNDGINSGSITLKGGDTYFLRMRSKTDGPAEYAVDIEMKDATGVPVAGGQQVIPGVSAVSLSETGDDQSLSSNDDDRQFVPAGALVATHSSSTSGESEAAYRRQDENLPRDAVFAELLVAWGQL